MKKQQSNTGINGSIMNDNFNPEIEFNKSGDFRTVGVGKKQDRKASQKNKF